MSKVYAIVIDPTLKDRNGGSYVLWHHLHALEEFGHATGMISLDDEIPKDADWVMFQGEWWNHIKPNLERSKAKRICWLGHYSPHSMYDMPKVGEIKADIFHTQWKGECVEWAEKIIGQKINYLPHGACHKCHMDGELIENVPPVIFVGNSFKERSEDWIAGIAEKLSDIPNEELKNYYRSAIVCPNIHGDFQKGISTPFMQVPGHMVNERTFQIILAGGFCVADNTPLLAEFFNMSEVHRCDSKEEFFKTVNYFCDHPEEREAYMKKAKQRILNEHLYTHRWEELLKQL